MYRSRISDSGRIRRGFRSQFDWLYYSLFGWGYSSDHSLFNWYLNKMSYFLFHFLFNLPYFLILNSTIPAFFSFYLLSDLSTLFKYLIHGYFEWKEIKIFNGYPFYFIWLNINLNSNAIFWYFAAVQFLFFLKLIFYVCIYFSICMCLVKEDLLSSLSAFLCYFAFYCITLWIRILNKCLKF